MSEKTDLKRVKTYCSLLVEEVPIGQTDLWPMVAHHFFTNTGYYHMKDTSGQYVVGILENDSAAYEAWKADMKAKIEKAKDVYYLFSMTSKPYLLLFVKLIRDLLSEKDFAYLLKQAFVSTEFPNSDKDCEVDELVEFFEEVDVEYLMDKEEMAIYNALPDEVTVYRGVTSNNLSGTEALSWTLNPEVAEWFANRFESIKGRVYVAKINKNDIFAYFDSRSECEVIVDPNYLTNIQIYKDFQKK